MAGASCQATDTEWQSRGPGEDRRSRGLRERAEPADERLVTNLPSLPNLPSRSSSLRRLRTPILLVLLALCATLAFAAAATAEVVTVDGSTVGVARRSGATGKTSAKTFANPEGNPVLHNEKVFVVYWDPAEGEFPSDHIHGDWQEGIDTFLHDVGADSGAFSNNYSVLAQYDDKTNAPAAYKDVFGGAYTDTTPYPTNGCTDPNPFAPADRLGEGGKSVCLSANQVSAEIQNFVASHGLPKGMSTVYFLITPPGATVCLDEGGATGNCSTAAETETSYDNSFCSYHAALNPGGLATGDANTLLYGVVPWDSAGEYGDFHLLSEDQRPGEECQDGATGDEEPNQIPCPDQYDGACDHALFDLIDNQLWLQQENIVTDPLLNSWKDSYKAEAGDECRFFFGPTEGSNVPEEGTLAGNLKNQAINGMPAYLSDAFNLAGVRLDYPGVKCVKGTNLQAKFTAPNPVNAGEVVSFDGMESNITQNAGINFPNGGPPAATYATYSWNFGDGTPEVTGFAPGAPMCEAPWLSPCAASVFHTFAYGGTYYVKLKVTDVGGDVNQTEQEVSVLGPPPPAPPVETPPATGTTGSTTSTGTSTSTTGGSTGTTGSGTPANPVAAAAITSRSLKTTLRGGLAVHYSVNEQVAGHFNVLITAALAKKLKLHGTRATGLPAGTPPEVVIARAVLVTTKAGSSTVHIKFTKSIATRLRKAHKVALLLQMYVRDAASKSPLTTTILSSVTLAG